MGSGKLMVLKKPLYGGQIRNSRINTLMLGRNTRSGLDEYPIIPALEQLKLLKVKPLQTQNEKLWRIKKKAKADKVPALQKRNQLEQKRLLQLQKDQLLRKQLVQ